MAIMSLPAFIHVLLLAFLPSYLAVEPVQVYILAGQSNMEGRASVQHLTNLLQNDLTRAPYEHLVNDQNEFIERQDVLVYYPEVSEDEFLPLAPGLGFPAKDRFGAELEFGTVAGDAHLGGNVLLIKIAWGGKDLAVDFRPPSRGSNTYTTWQPGDPGPPDEGTPVAEENYHASYDSLVDTVHGILGRIEAGDVFDGQTTWDLKGCVWWQGWNDLVYPRKVDEYEENLKALIRDLRLDWNAPDLPFVIGELGQHGFNPHGWLRENIYKMRRSERNVAWSDEFRDTVRFAMTSPYLVETGDHFDGDYHYYGRADTMVLVGRAFGQTMLQLLEDIAVEKVESGE